MAVFETPNLPNLISRKILSGRKIFKCPYFLPFRKVYTVYLYFNFFSDSGDNLDDDDIKSSPTKRRSRKNKPPTPESSVAGSDVANLEDQPSKSRR